MRFPCPECGVLALVRSYRLRQGRMRLLRHGFAECEPGWFRPAYRPLWSFEDGWDTRLYRRNAARIEAGFRELLEWSESFEKRKAEVLAYVAAVDAEEEAERAAKAARRHP